MKYIRSVYLFVLGLGLSLAGGVLIWHGADAKIFGQDVSAILILSGVALIFFSLPSPDQQRIISAAKQAKEALADKKEAQG